MITQIEVENYKSIEKLTVDLGRVNVFIGENGAGKSNLLEAIALGAATAAQKLDNEFLASRGIRVTKPEHMRSGFSGSEATSPIIISAKHDAGAIETYSLENDNKPYAKWRAQISPGNLDFDIDKFKSLVEGMVESLKTGGSDKEIKDTLEFMIALRKSVTETDEQSTNGNDATATTEFRLPQNKMATKFAEALLADDPKRTAIINELRSFVIYSPENSSLRTFEREGQIEPLGINGEGLLKLVSIYAKDENQGTLKNVKESLKVLDWFVDFEPLLNSSEARLLIKDRYLADDIEDFDHKSTNEGFFFLLFYFLLFYSGLTPRFFAIDNIDASLNPKLCRKLITELVKASKDNAKQCILTTHNPAILDGLNLDDDEQRLFVISRNLSGKTKVKRILKPRVSADATPPKLSELFLRGTLGGLPKGF
jgi:AAA15 family ATPase/GTPase